MCAGPQITGLLFDASLVELLDVTCHAADDVPIIMAGLASHVFARQTEEAALFSIHEHEDAIVLRKLKACFFPATSLISLWIAATCYFVTFQRNIDTLTLPRDSQPPFRVRSAGDALHKMPHLLNL